MRNNKFRGFLIILSSLLVFANYSVFSQNIQIDNFENYANKDSLSTKWKAFGFSTLDYGVVHDTNNNAPIGTRYFSYTYSGNSQTTWGGAIEKTDLANNPLDFSSTKAGLQFFLKGDGTDNVIYVRLSNGASNWSSNKISLTDTTWHEVYIPYVADTANGFSNGNMTTTDLMNDLKNVTDFRVYIDHPKIDETPYTIYFDEFYSAQHFPPKDGIKLEDFESYPDNDALKAAWQFFGYSTLDYNVKKDPANAQTGFKYIDYMYVGDNQTTWGGAMRTRNFTPVDLSNIKAGIQFWLKGDGSDNNFSFRFYSGLEMWSSAGYPLKDTTWHLITIPFKVDSTSGLRYIGNNPDNPMFTSDIGTESQLKTDLANVTELRFYVRNPTIDFVHKILYIDGIYAVNEFPPLPPVSVDNFESYSSSSDLNTTWQSFGVNLTLTTSQDSIKEGSKAAVISYKGDPTAQNSLIRKNNIIPGLNFSELSGGLQFWLKGDGTNNTIDIRVFNGSEMWASNPISLNSTDWRHIGIPFTVDSTDGFRYLGNDPQNPSWSSNIGTNAQLKGDLANIDQIFVELRSQEQSSTTTSFVVDNIEGVDKLAEDIFTSVDSKVNSKVPKKYNLSQNYPNPFNPSTTIRYELPSSGLVTLQVYNLLGQKVAELVNGRQTAGIHEVNFDASKLSSGVYFYTIKANGFVSTRKMLLLK